MACPLINIWAVIVSAVAFWALGALWYSPVLFGKRWQKEVGLSNEKLKNTNMVVVFGVSFLLMFVMVFGLNLTINVHKPEEITWLSGLYMGLFIGLIFSMTTMGINYLYQRRSFVLWLIDGIYITLGLTIAGIILAVWK
jgi:hypothetical protein